MVNGAYSQTFILKWLWTKRKCLAQSATFPWSLHTWRLITILRLGLMLTSGYSRSIRTIKIVWLHLFKLVLHFLSVGLPLQNVFLLNLAEMLFWNNIRAQFVISALVTMSKYELFQSQTALLILLMPDTPKTCSSVEPHLNLKQNDTRTQVRVCVITIVCNLNGCY